MASTVLDISRIPADTAGARDTSTTIAKLNISLAKLYCVIFRNNVDLDLIHIFSGHIYVSRDGFGAKNVDIIIFIVII